MQAVLCNNMLASAKRLEISRGIFVLQAPVAQSVSARYLYDSMQQSDAEVVSSSLTWSNVLNELHKFTLVTMCCHEIQETQLWNFLHKHFWDFILGSLV